MEPLKSLDINPPAESYEYTMEEAREVLLHELKKGVDDYLAGNVYTMEEVWEELDKI